MANGAPLWLIITTVATYLAFLIGFSEQIFEPITDFDANACNNILDIFDCFGLAAGLVSSFAQFVTLGGFDSPLPLLFVQIPLLLVMATGWLLVLIDIALP